MSDGAEVTTEVNGSGKEAKPQELASRDGLLMSIKDLRVWFELRRFGFGHAGFVRAVDGVTFDLYRGEAIAIVGESGCGKSSLMKTILGLYRPREGAIVFDGKNLNEMGKDGLRWYRSRVGYVQQDPYGALPPFMSIQRILEEPVAVNGVTSQEERLPRLRE